MVKRIRKSTSGNKRGGGYVALLNYEKKGLFLSDIIKKRGEDYGKRGAKRKI